MTAQEKYDLACFQSVQRARAMLRAAIADCDRGSVRYFAEPCVEPPGKSTRVWLVRWRDGRITAAHFYSRT